jgi:O-antigen/teichoic acid export membrane protein
MTGERSDDAKNAANAEKDRPNEGGSQRAPMLIVVTFVVNAALNFLLGLAVAAGLGPEAYGRFSIAFAAALALALLLFDWLRLSATRFYREEVRATAPELRASLDAGYFAGAAGLVLAAAVLATLGIDAGLGAGMIAAIALVAIANGFFDYFSALLRARFRNRAYSVLVILKNALAFAAMVGAAFWTRDPLAVMACAGVSAGAATFLLRKRAADPGAHLTRARTAQIGGYLRYGLPVVLANLFYQAMVLANRGLAASSLGYGAAGKLSLATDVTLRLMLAAGAALDIYLFQLAVHQKAVGGAEAAKAQVRRNSLIIFAAYVLICAGYMADMPAFVATIAPAAFREDFARLAFILTPGVGLFCLGQFCLNPIAQIEGRTNEVMLAGLGTAALDIGWLLLAPPRELAGYALVHAVSLAAGFALMLGLTWRWRDHWPRSRDLAGVAVAGFCASAAMSFTREAQPALAGLLLTALVGAGVFAAVLLALDPGGLFRPAVARLASRLPGGKDGLFNRLG